MRLLQLISSPGVNGAVMHAVRFARLLAANGHSVAVAARPDSWAERELNHAVELFRTHFDRTPAEFARCADFCRAHRFDATHSHLTRAHSFGWRLERRSGVPHIAHLHSHHWQFHWFFQRRTLALSPAAAVKQRRWYFRRRAQVAVLPNYADTARFAPATPDPGRLAALVGGPAEAQVIACVAEIQPRKGQLYLVRALPAILDAVPTTRLALFGREGAKPHYAAAVRGEAARLGVADRIIWTDFRDDIPALLPHCAVAVLPSLAEPFALGGLEAMACGLPLVATHVGGFPEMVTTGENGLLVPPRDPAALAAALIRLLGDATLRRRMGAAARARVERDFSAAGHLARYTEILRGWGIGAA